MSERLVFRLPELPKEVVVINDVQGEKKIYLLKCSRRRLGELLDVAADARVTRTG
jgi:hypothetical protein